MVLPWKRFVPSPGQGAIAIEMRRRDSRFATVRRVDDPATRAAVSAERAVASALGASCNLPFGALGIVRRESLELHAEVLAVDGRVTVSSARTGPIGASVRLARRVARDLLAGGAQTLLDRYR